MNPSPPAGASATPDHRDQLWPWALGVIIVPSAPPDRRSVRDLRLGVAVEAYKLGVFLVDTLVVSAEHAAVDLDTVRTVAGRATVDTLLVLDTCTGDPLIDLAMPDDLTIRALALPPSDPARRAP